MIEVQTSQEQQLVNRTQEGHINGLTDMPKAASALFRSVLVTTTLAVEDACLSCTASTNKIESLAVVPHRLEDPDGR